MARVRTLFWGLRRRCPNCGEGGIFRRWLVMLERCPRCGWHFEREDGYWTGSIAINTIVTELVFVTALVVAVLMTWPEIPMKSVLIGGLVLNAVVPVLFHPFSRTLWAAIDLILHPLETEETDEIFRLRFLRQDHQAAD